MCLQYKNNNFLKEVRNDTCKKKKKIQIPINYPGDPENNILDRDCSLLKINKHSHISLFYSRYI
jgi:hypothetical protein